MQTNLLTHFHYLLRQDRRITLPVRFAAASVWTFATSTNSHPWWESTTMTTVVVLAWLSLALHTHLTFRVVNETSIPAVYLGFTLFDSGLLSLLIADTGGLTSPWTFAVSLQQIRFLKATLVNRSWTWLGFLFILMWFIPVMWVDGLSAIQSTRFIVTVSLMIFIYISAYQVVDYLNSLYYSQVSLQRQLREATQSDNDWE